MCVHACVRACVLAFVHVHVCVRVSLATAVPAGAGRCPAPSVSSPSLGSDPMVRYSPAGLRRPSLVHASARRLSTAPYRDCQYGEGRRGRERARQGMEGKAGGTRKEPRLQPDDESACRGLVQD